MLSKVQGQDDALVYLKRVAEGKYTSPLLLTGDDGVGKRFSIQCLAQQMFCTGTRDDACDCVHCLQLKLDAHPDLITVTSQDGKDIGIEASRQIIDQCKSFPALAKVRVILIDGADRLTTPAANALLKVIEEPPRTIRFFLTTSAFERILPTIQSRCGLVRFQRLPEAFVLSLLTPFEANPTKALVYARLADGSAGQAVRFWGSSRIRLRDRMVDILKLSLSRDLIGLFSTIDEIEKDKQLSLGLRFFLALIHDLFVVPNAPDRLVSLDLVEELRALRSQFRDEKLDQLWSAMRALQVQQLTSSISLPFHLKTQLARIFM